MGVSGSRTSPELRLRRGLFTQSTTNSPAETRDGNFPPVSPTSAPATGTGAAAVAATAGAAGTALSPAGGRNCACGMYDEIV
mmetsp:Transcript_60024/g.159567  ORF Transcript_60024/g.159567 Transcript_60024/m.159567 type:complete len:82 (-) Transcript_60024:1332-1577(-)